MISLDVAAPGKIGSFFCSQASRISSVEPGETPNCAPALIASVTSDAFVIVPAPTTPPCTLAISDMT